MLQFNSLKSIMHNLTIIQPIHRKHPGGYDAGFPLKPRPATIMFQLRLTYELIHDQIILGEHSGTSTKNYFKEWQFCGNKLYFETVEMLNIPSHILSVGFVPYWI